MPHTRAAALALPSKAPLNIGLTALLALTSFLHRHSAPSSHSPDRLPSVHKRTAVRPCSPTQQQRTATMLRWASARLLAGQAAAAAEVACAGPSWRGMASVSAATQAMASKQPAVAEAEVTVQKDWKAVQIPKGATERMPTITVEPGQAFPGDLRSTSGLGMGDGLTTHTEKWLQVGRTPGWGLASGTGPAGAWSARPCAALGAGAAAVVTLTSPPLAPRRRAS